MKDRPDTPLLLTIEWSTLFPHRPFLEHALGRHRIEYEIVDPGADEVDDEASPPRARSAPEEI